MPESENKLAIWGAIAANIVIAVSKAFAAFFTGSSAMLSECVHSLIDTGDGLLLLWGERQSKRPADASHPFGHGRELYFWTLVVAMLIFGLGGGVSVFEGVMHVLHPKPIGDVVWSYSTLGVAFLFEGTSLIVSLRIFLRHKRPRRSLFAAIRASKDPALFTVVFEDSAALAGIVIALGGVILSTSFDMPRADGVASILIGVLLAGVASFLGRESKSLLIGEAADVDDVPILRSIIADDEAIAEIYDFRANQLSAREIIVSAHVSFERGLDIVAIEDAVDRMGKKLRATNASVRHVFISPAPRPGS